MNPDRNPGAGIFLFDIQENLK